MGMKRLKLMRMLCVVGLSACGVAEMESLEETQGAPGPSMQSSESNVIVGELDWMSVNALAPNSPERARSKAVGFLRYNDQGSTYRCTAWLVSNDVVITNNHCIGSEDEARSARVSFNYEDGVSESGRIWYTCSTLLKTWPAEDISALRCQPLQGVLPGQRYGYLRVAENDAPKDLPLYVIHQNCYSETGADCVSTKKYSPGKVVDAYSSEYRMWHDADTLGGSSGAPLLSRSSHVVVGLNRGHYGSVNVAVRAGILKSRLAEIGL